MDLKDIRLLIKMVDESGVDEVRLAQGDFRISIKKKVAARVENTTRDTGVIGASGPLATEIVELGYLSRDSNLKPGQQVVTSGEGGIFPAGIPIGQIVDVQPVDYGTRAEARVRLAAKLNALQEVWVKFP